jgi:hypothetical protein
MRQWFDYMCQAVPHIESLFRSTEREEGETARRIVRDAQRLLWHRRDKVRSQAEEDGQLSLPSTLNEAQGILRRLRDKLFTGPTVPPTGASTSKRGTVNQRMLEELLRNPPSARWTQREWAAFLKCSPAAVDKAQTWDKVKSVRALAEVDRLDRQRK